MAERGSEELNIRLAIGRRGDARSGVLGARLSKAIGGARLGAGVSFRGGGVSGANAYIGTAGPIRPGEWRDVRPRTAKEIGEWIFQTSMRMPTPLLFPQHVAKQLQIEGHVARMLDFINEPFGYHSSPDHYLVEVVDCLKKQTRI